MPHTVLQLDFEFCSVCMKSSSWCCCQLPHYKSWSPIGLPEHWDWLMICSACLDIFVNPNIAVSTLNHLKHSSLRTTSMCVSKSKLKVTVDLQGCLSKNHSHARRLCYIHRKVYIIIKLIKFRIRRNNFFKIWFNGKCPQASKCKIETIC